MPKIIQSDRISRIASSTRYRWLNVADDPTCGLGLVVHPDRLDYRDQGVQVLPGSPALLEPNLEYTVRNDFNALTGFLPTNVYTNETTNPWRAFHGYILSNEPVYSDRLCVNYNENPLTLIDLVGGNTRELVCVPNVPGCRHITAVLINVATGGGVGTRLLRVEARLPTTDPFAPQRTNSYAGTTAQITDTAAVAVGADLNNSFAYNVAPHHWLIRILKDAPGAFGASETYRLTVGIGRFAGI